MDQPTIIPQQQIYSPQKKTLLPPTIQPIIQPTLPQLNQPTSIQMKPPALARMNPPVIPRMNPPVMPQPLPQQVPTSPQQVLTSPQQVPTSLQQVPTSPQQVPTSPQHIPTSPQIKQPLMPQYVPTSPQIKQPVIQPILHSTSSQQVPTSPQHIPTSPQIKQPVIQPILHSTSSQIKQPVIQPILHSTSSQIKQPVIQPILHSTSSQQVPTSSPQIKQPIMPQHVPTSSQHVPTSTQMKPHVMPRMNPPVMQTPVQVMQPHVMPRMNPPVMQPPSMQTPSMQQPVMQTPVHVMQPQNIEKILSTMDRIILAKDYKEMTFEELTKIGLGLNVEIPNNKNRKNLYDRIIKKIDSTFDTNGNKMYKRIESGTKIEFFRVGGEKDVIPVKDIKVIEEYQTSYLVKSNEQIRLGHLSETNIPNIKNFINYVIDENHKFNFKNLGPFMLVEDMKNINAQPGFRESTNDDGITYQIIKVVNIETMIDANKIYTIDYDENGQLNQGFYERRGYILTTGKIDKTVSTFKPVAYYYDGKIVDKNSIIEYIQTVFVELVKNDSEIHALKEMLKKGKKLFLIDSTIIDIGELNDKTINNIYNNPDINLSPAFLLAVLLLNKIKTF